MKNENEYRIEEKLYVKTIKRCSCAEKTGDEYTLCCKIHQRGEKNYSYRPGTAYLERLGGKKLWLSEEAATTVMHTVNQFENSLTDLKREEYRLPIIEGEFDLYFRQHEEYIFETLLHITKDGKEKFILSCCCGFTGIIAKVWWGAFYCGMDDHPTIKIIRRSTVETLGENPLYAYAVRTGDECALKQLRLYYNIATAEDCKDLSKMLGVRILPQLPDEYDKNYVVRADTIDRPLLKASGYSVSHRPNFAMKGSTHDSWMLNPHSRSGVDAAKKEESAITFGKFLELFETAPKDN